MKLLNFIAFLLLLPFIVNGQDRKADSLILVDIFNSLDGPNWTNPANWLTNTPLDEWKGIRLENDRVTSLAFINQKPSGPFPVKALELEKLHTLEFRGGANVTGSIPADLIKLKELQRFSVSGCEMSGAVPNIFTQFPYLKTLILSNNNFEGPLPDIPNGLSLFYAERNNFSGKIPLSWINNDLGTLNISDNKLTGSFSDVLETWSGLRQLYLSDNDWDTSTFPKWLADKQSLVRFICENCNISGELPSDLDLSNLQSYAQMSIADNHLSGDVSLLFTGPNATNKLYLDVGGNNFEGEFPCHLIHKASSITIMDNKFTSMTPFSDSVSFGSFQITNNKFNYEALEPLQKYIELDSIIGVSYYTMQPTLNADTFTITTPTTLILHAGDLHPYTKYEWKGPNLVNETGPTLEVILDQNSNGGTYKCFMTNEAYPELMLRRNDVVINTDFSTSTNDIGQDKVHVYPNPTTDYIRLTLPRDINEATYKLFANDGHIVKSGAIKENQEIDIQEVNSGTYMLKIHFENQMYSQIIVKK